MDIFGLPVIGWLIGAVVNISLAIPFWPIWNSIAPKFFYWIPPVYQQVGFWECVGLFIVVSILKSVLFPNFASSSSSSET